MGTARQGTCCGHRSTGNVLWPWIDRGRVVAMDRRGTCYGHWSTGNVLWAQVERKRVVGTGREGTCCGHRSTGNVLWPWVSRAAVSQPWYHSATPAVHWSLVLSGLDGAGGCCVIDAPAVSPLPRPLRMPRSRGSRGTLCPLPPRPPPPSPRPVLPGARAAPPSHRLNWPIDGASDPLRPAVIGSERIVHWIQI